MQKILFIVNPISGHKDKQPVVDVIIKRLNHTKYDCEFVNTEYQGHAMLLARNTDAEIVVAVGGDGTVDEVARGLAGSSKTLGIIPCGSGDGLALHLGIRRNVYDAVEVINAGLTVPMDYGMVDDKPFFCTVGMGIDAQVSYLFANSGKRGLKTYIVDAINVWKKFRPEKYTIVADGRKWSGDASIVTVANVNQWGNHAKIAPLASVSDGMLDVVIVKPFKTIDIPILAHRLFHGSMDRSQFVDTFRAAEIHISRESSGPTHRDGDPCSLGSDIDVMVVPSSLKIMIPFEKYRQI